MNVSCFIMFYVEIWNWICWLCSREKYAMLFDEPIPIHANSWYVAWARISGPSSDCGSTGQSVVTTEDQ